MNMSTGNVSIVPYYPLSLSYAPHPPSENRPEQIFMLCIIVLLVVLLLLRHFTAQTYLQRQLERAQHV